MVEVTHPEKYSAMWMAATIHSKIFICTNSRGFQFGKIFDWQRLSMDMAKGIWSDFSYYHTFFHRTFVGLYPKGIALQMSRSMSFLSTLSIHFQLRHYQTPKHSSWSLLPVISIKYSILRLLIHHYSNFSEIFTNEIVTKLKLLCLVMMTGHSLKIII